MPLSDQEIKYLIEKAESYIDPSRGGDIPGINQALECYNQIIENVPPHPHYFEKRAEIKYILAHRLGLSYEYLNSAIEDMDKAIELNPDKGEFYRIHGQYLWSILKNNKEIPDNERTHLLEKVITDYKACISRSPSDPRVWLNLIEVNIVLQNWDEAISFYGQCKPYINNEEDKLIRSWLGCLALALAGDPIEEEDITSLYDQTIRLNKLYDIVANICSFLGKMHGKEGHKEKWKKVNDITDLFIDHFNAWIDRGTILQRLNRYADALGSFNKAIELNPDFTLVWFKRGLMLMELNRDEEALNAFNKVLKLTCDKTEKEGAVYYKGILLLKLNRRMEWFLLFLTVAPKQWLRFLLTIMIKCLLILFIIIARLLGLLIKIFRIG